MFFCRKKNSFFCQTIIKYQQNRQLYGLFEKLYDGTDMYVDSG